MINIRFLILGLLLSAFVCLSQSSAQMVPGISMPLLVGGAKIPPVAANLGVANGIANSMTITTGATCAAHSAIVVVVADRNGTVLGTVADQVSNSYSVAEGGGMNPGVDSGGIFYAVNTTNLPSGDTITYTAGSPTGSGIGMSATCVTGVSTSPYDTGVASKANGSGTSPSITGGSASVAEELDIAAVMWNNGSGASFTQASGWSAPPNSGGGTTNGQNAGGNRSNLGISGLTFAPTINSAFYLVAIIGLKPL